MFPFLAIISGVLGGSQFPLANRIYLGGFGIGSKDQRIGQSAGLTYAMDLFGSCMGAFLTKAFLIPVLGLAVACLLTAAVNAIAAGVFFKRFLE